MTNDEPMAKKAKTTPDDKPEWQMFFDLQCPYSKKLWMEKLPELRKRFGDEYNITTHITSLAFHRQAFPAHCAAYMVGVHKGGEMRHKFEMACFANMDRYEDYAVEKLTPAELHQVFCTIAEQEGILDGEKFTKDFFLKNIANHKDVVMPTWFEHKKALAVGVLKAPQHVIDGKLVPDTESSWNVEDYESALKKI